MCACSLQGCTGWFALRSPSHMITRGHHVAAHDNVRPSRLADMIEQADLEKGAGGSAGEGRRRGVWKWECVDEARRRRSYGKDKRGVGERTGPIAPPSCTSGLTAAAPSTRMGCGYRERVGEGGSPHRGVRVAERQNSMSNPQLSIAVFGFATVQHAHAHACSTIHTFLVSYSSRVVAVLSDLAGLAYIVYVSCNKAHDGNGKDTAPPPPPMGAQDAREYCRGFDRRKMARHTRYTPRHRPRDGGAMGGDPPATAARQTATAA